MSEDFHNWACVSLDGLGLPDASIIIKYLEPLDSPQEVREYLNSMLDTTNKDHCNFVNEFIEYQAKSKVDKRFYLKENFIEKIQPSSHGKKKNNKSQTSINDSIKNKKKEPNVDKQLCKENNGQHTSTIIANSQNAQGKQKVAKDNGKQPSVATVSSTSAGTKKKTKFVNLYSTNGMSSDVVMLSGRNKCDCLASKHKLINNCLSCGRIVCEQEGAGQCMFCGNIVFTKDEEAGIIPMPANQNKNNKANKKASVKDVAADIEKAVLHKNTLLEYDKSSEKRTVVFDDESDYFESNSRWISKENREILQKKELELKAKKYDRRQNIVSVDLLGRKILEDKTNDPGIYDPDDPIIKAILEHQSEGIFTESEPNNDRSCEMSHKPLYVETADCKLVNVDRPLKFPVRSGMASASIVIHMLCDAQYV